MGLTGKSKYRRCTLLILQSNKKEIDEKSVVQRSHDLKLLKEFPDEYFIGFI
jgi:hypothetical protein